MLCRPRRSRSGRSPRRGSLTPFLLVVLTLFLAAFALAFNLSALREAKLELRTVADSAALAAANELANDDFLKQDATLVPPIFQQAARAAQNIAGQNTYRGQPFQLNIDSMDQVNFGHLSKPRGGTFTPIAPTDNAHPLYFQTNAVRIVLDQTRANNNPFTLGFANITGKPTADIPLRATAMIDRAVTGFRPVTSQPIPLAPLALLSDPTGTNTRAWENRVEQRNGPDQFSFQRATKTFTTAPDQLHEMPIELAVTAGQVPTANVALLNIGNGDINTQVQRGITRDDLQGFGGQIVLDAQQQVLLPGNLLGPTSGPDAQALQQALQALHASGEARAWPLYTGVDGSGNVIVTGFVAARVVHVEPFSSGQPIRFTVQPAQLVTASALTDLTRQENGTIRINPYLGKVRLVE